MDGNHGIRSGFYDMEQHTIVPYRSHPVLKNMGYTSTVNDIIYRKGQMNCVLPLGMTVCGSITSKPGKHTW